MGEVRYLDSARRTPVKQGCDVAWYFQNAKNEERIRHATAFSVNRLARLFAHREFQREVVATWRGYVKHLTLEAVCQHVLDDNPHLWNRNREYYAALMMELNDRFYAVIRALSDTASIPSHEEVLLPTLAAISRETQRLFETPVPAENKLTLDR